jgi:predicted chitinase
MAVKIHDFTTKQGAIDAIRYECQAQGLCLKTQIAYILATVEHETGDTFKPVSEAYWLKNHEDWLKHNHPEYYPYYGRGFVQLTWDYNYKKYSKILGIDLVNHPEKALEPNIALSILVDGFKNGGFSGKKIEDYINENKSDFINARRCINGVDKATHIADLAKKYL